MAENVKVIVRCRPMNKYELDSNYKVFIIVNTLCSAHQQIK